MVRPGQVPVLDTKVSGKPLHADSRVITYGRKSIALEEVEWVSYWATHTATRHYFSQTTHDSEWGFKVGRYPHFGGPKIAVRYDLAGRQDHAPDSWMFLANLSRQYLEPRLVADFADRIRRGETVAVGGRVRVCRDGIACPKPRLSLPWYVIGRIQPYNGVVWIYQADAEKPVLDRAAEPPQRGLAPRPRRRAHVVARGDVCAVFGTERLGGTGVDGFNVNLEALEQCRTEMAGQVGPMASAADDLPAGVSAGAFGGLEGAGALADAVNGVVKAVGDEIGAASTQLEQVAAAVEAVIDTVRGTDKNHARVMAPA